MIQSLFVCLESGRGSDTCRITLLWIPFLNRRLGCRVFWAGDHTFIRHWSVSGISSKGENGSGSCFMSCNITIIQNNNKHYAQCINLTNRNQENILANPLLRFIWDLKVQVTRLKLHCNLCGTRGTVCCFPIKLKILPQLAPSRVLLGYLTNNQATWE